MSRFADVSSDNSIIDQDNRARADRLAIKLARLKNVAVDIEEESRDHIPMLDDVDNSYTRTFNALGSSSNKLLGLIKANRRSRHLFCYTVVVVFIIIIILYSWLSSKGS